VDVQDNEPAERAGLGEPEHERSGGIIDGAVDKAEAGSRAEGDHTPSGQAASGESRVEKMVDVEGIGTDRPPSEP
jgi:hypothetical protein